jgi:hypothetical protein
METPFLVKQPSLSGVPIAVKSGSSGFFRAHAQNPALSMLYDFQDHLAIYSIRRSFA